MGIRLSALAVLTTRASPAQAQARRWLTGGLLASRLRALRTQLQLPADLLAVAGFRGVFRGRAALDDSVSY